MKKLLLLLIIPLLFFLNGCSNNSQKTISKSELENYAYNNQIEKIDFVHETGNAEIYMSSDYLIQNPNLQISKTGPHYQFNTIDSKVLNEILTKYQISYNVISRPDYIGPALSWIVPIFILLILISSFVLNIIICFKFIGAGKDLKSKKLTSAGQIQLIILCMQIVLFLFFIIGMFYLYN